jgi:hypothetical protein
MTRTLVLGQAQLVGDLVTRLPAFDGHVGPSDPEPKIVLHDVVDGELTDALFTECADLRGQIGLHQCEGFAADDVSATQAHRKIEPSGKIGIEPAGRGGEFQYSCLRLDPDCATHPESLAGY